MRKFLCRAAALVLALALICGAALAETLDEFCSAYNEFLPSFIGTVGFDEETSGALVALSSSPTARSSRRESSFPATLPVRG